MKGKMKRIWVVPIVTFLVTFSVIPAGASTHPVLPDWARSATIYEVNLRQYTTAGTFNAFSASLPRLQKLGIKILWFMPIQPISEKNRKGSLGSEYSVADYKGINPEFGSAADFGALVTKAHQMGFKVILDWVANHSGWDNPWITNKSWYHQDSSGNILSPNPDWTDVAWLNYENPDLRAAMIDAMMYWVKTFDIDGFRSDVADGVPVDFWNEANNSLQSIKPLFMLAEAQNHYDLLERTFVADYNWNLLNLMSELSVSTKDKTNFIETAVRQGMTYPKGTFPMNFITNHDENTWNGTEFSRLGKAVYSMAALTFVYPGIPLIYSGQEVGNQKQIAFFEKDLIPGLSKENAFTTFYSKLIALKSKNNALWNDSPATLNPLDSNNPEVISFSRSRGGNRVIMIFNISTIKQAVKVKLGSLSGKYKVFSSGKSISYNGASTLAPWGFEIYSST
jgi:glycosidase